MNDEIKIQAEPLGVASMCKFTIDRPLAAGRSYFFGSREAAEMSPLAKRFFAMPGMASVLISHDSVTITKFAPEPWSTFGRPIGAAIREHLRAGDSAIPDSLFSLLPSSAELRQRVESVIQSEIAPAVASHGGSISVVDVQNNVVMLKLGGGCQGCGNAAATLKFGVEAAIRRAVPEIGEIIDTTNHAAGTNPYIKANA